MARCPLPAVLLLLLAAGPLPAADSPRASQPGESAATGRRLDAADRLAADKQYPAAAAEYARILEESGDDLVPVGDRLSVPARRLCHLRLVALPPETLRPYRTRVDPQAKKWLDQGAADRDAVPLRRVVEEAFCSRPAETALDLLGDLAFERGRFHEAERWWRMLALPASEAAARAGQPPPWSKAGAAPPNLELLYPDPKTDVARARAKQILALLFLSDSGAAKAELEAFRDLHPQAEGHLAGRKGNYADILQAVAARPIPPGPADDAWPTFGGSPARGLVLPAEPNDPNRLNRLVANGPAWRLSFGAANVAAEPLSGAERARYLPYLPAIVGRDVLVADARSVTALDAITGASQTWDLAKDGGRRVSTVPSAPADLRYTLTVADGRIYARLGVQGLHALKQGAEAGSFLVCLELAEPGHKLRTVWLRDADPPARGSPPMFEGTPVVRDGLLHVAVTRFEAGTPTVTEIRCYSADAGALRWKVDVASAHDLPQGPRDLPQGPRYRHHLLTLAGRHVVYASHAGSVVALDARTGRRAWAVHYPSTIVKAPAGHPIPRDLAPALYAEGRLYVAPADYDRLLCLDPETGQILWELPGAAVVHLLGVGSGRLIFATPKGIRAVRASDGTDSGGWQLFSDINHPGLPSYGRGFLAGEYVFWPTVDGVKVLSQRDGTVPLDLIPGPLSRRLGHLLPGHMAYADGILAVADKSGLRVYVAQGPSPGASPEAPRGRATGALHAPNRPTEDGHKLALAALGRVAEPERKHAAPAGATDLTPPLIRSWENQERLLPLAEGAPGADVLLVRGTKLVCRNAATGTERWARSVAGSPSWAGRHAEVAVVAGLEAAQAFALPDGTPLWELAAPDAVHFLDPRLSTFQITSGRFFCLQGECRLLALDVASGRVLWQHWSPAARLDADVPGCRFSAYYLATDERVLLQFAGRCRLLDARTGAVLHEERTEPVLWEQPPLPLREGRVGVVMGRRIVAALDLASGKPIWSHKLPRLDSLTGEPPLLVGGPGALFVVIPRNDGYWLRRLDPDTGRPLWDEEVSVGPDRIDPGSFAVDGSGVYYTSRNVVAAVALDGHLLWEEGLPGPAGLWRLRRAGPVLLAWPTAARRANFHSRWLSVSLELGVTCPPEDRPGRGVPVLLLDPRDGQVVQRLNLMPPVPRAQGRLALGEELTAFPRLSAGRTAADGAVVRLTAQGLVVGWDNRAWALRPDR
jgi:outer membrane protein assembly factor BamB